MNELKNLSSIFEHRVIRIPDYQRGYAWRKHQLDDFWEDLIQLSEDRVHYTGVVTLEPVSPENFSRWDDDLWLIEGKGYKPYYVVDGQQRLTTAMILIQAILETVPEDAELNYQLPEDIRQQYVLHTARDGICRSFLFGYEKDNPSDEFLRTQIFGEHSSSNHDEQTLYTRNLDLAKSYFKERLSDLELEEVAGVYKKLTQKFKFNLYEIDSEIDVFVTFETMNNRGKSLSSLELLKNRMIYLSTLFKEHEERSALRERINSAWKTIYEYLGKNANEPLSDEDFLRNHWTMYFKFTRQRGDDYIDFLLDKKFTAKNVTHPDEESEKLTIEELDEYVTSLQKAVKYWFYMHHPYFSIPRFEDENNKKLLDRLGRLGFSAFKPLVLAAFCREKPMEEVDRLLVAAERYNFTVFSMSRRRKHTGDSNFLNMARAYLSSDYDTDQVVAAINEMVEKHFSPEKFRDYIAENFDVGRHGFFHWDGIRYFCYEHEQYLQEKRKHSAKKLSWEGLKAAKKDHVTIEHIYPQDPDDSYWVERFGHLGAEIQTHLMHSLGNLLPLSRSKNSSLQKDSFPLKVNNGHGAGYYNGSVSENEVAQSAEWSPAEILSRGMTLLEFMEQRWSIELGDEESKRTLLHLNGLDTETSESPSAP